MLILPVLIAFITLNVFIPMPQARIDFTNAVCISNLKEKVNLDHCILKSINRTYKYLSLRVHFYKYVATNDVMVKFSLLKRANGYKPFLYNISLNGCKYMKNRSNAVIRYFHSLFEAYSNINHTCPFGLEDLVVDRLPISHVNNMVTNVLPMPTGDYLLHTEWYRENTLWATVRVYGTIS